MRRTEVRLTISIEWDINLPIMAIEWTGDLIPGWGSRKDIDQPQGLPRIPGTEPSFWRKLASTPREKARRLVEKLKRRTRRAGAR